ncbi:hypothetical protein KJ975_14410 [Myxococcota bacterium]|nr:hypothetical protein [Myxococcota bacterium]
MFKSKYGLISALLVIVATATAYFVVTSRVKTGVRRAAIQQLKRGDQIVRQNESFNQAQSIALAYKAATVVRPHVARIWDLRAKLAEAITAELPLFALYAKAPVMIAVVRKQAEDAKNDIVYWTAINGTDLSTSINTEWITPAEWEKLIKETKPTPVNPATAPAPVVTAAPAPAKDAAKGQPEAATDAPPVEVPVLFPGEEAGKFVIKPAAAPKYVSGSAKVAFTVDIAFMSEGAAAPLTMGELVVAFDSADVKPEAVEQIIMRIARNPQVRAFIPSYEMERTRLHEMLSAMSVVGEEKADAKPADAKPADAKAVNAKPAHGTGYELGNLTPYFVLLNFANGAVITRDKDDSKTIGYNHLKYSKEMLPFMDQTARTGQAAYDIVEHEAINRFPIQEKPAKLYHAASVPVIDGPRGAFLTILWPFDVRVGQIQSQSELDVAFFYGRHVFFPTFRGENTVKKVSQAEETLRGRLTDVQDSPLVADPTACIKTASFEFGGDDYLGSFYRFSRMTLTGKPYGYALFVSMDNIRKPYAGMGFIILLFGLLMLIMVIAMENLVFFYFYNSVDSINEGIQEVASGNLDFIFGRVSKETEGLSNSLNDVLNIVLGREPYDEEKGEAPTRAGIQFLVLGRLPEMPLDEKDPAVAPLVSASEEAYYNTLYQKFTMNWGKLGQEDAAPSREVFMLRVNLYERLVSNRTSCDRVYFELELQDGSLVLIPLPVNE